MQDNLTHQFKDILTDLNEIKKSLDPSNLDPANLNWENFLKKMPTLSIRFQDIIKKISLLRYYVVYPTKPESPDPKINTDALLCANDIPELNSENATCKQRYQEAINDLGLENSSAKERKSNLEIQISDHNLVCQNADNMANDLISAYKLTADNASFVPTAKLKPPPFDSIYAMYNGNNKLPVPPHISSRQ